MVLDGSSINLQRAQLDGVTRIMRKAYEPYMRCVYNAWSATSKRCERDGPGRAMCSSQSTISEPRVAIVSPQKLHRSRRPCCVRAAVSRCRRVWDWRASCARGSLPPQKSARTSVRQLQWQCYWYRQMHLGVLRAAALVAEGSSSFVWSCARITPERCGCVEHEVFSRTRTVPALAQTQQSSPSICVSNPTILILGRSIEYVM